MFPEPLAQAAFLALTIVGAVGVAWIELADRRIRRNDPKLRGDR